MYFVTVLSSDRGLLESIHPVLEEAFGEVEEATSVHPWDFSPSYTEELGECIWRRFLVFRELQEQGDLPDWKHSTNSIERQFLSYKRQVVKRLLNLDPGYVSGSQVVLASTKRYANRIYLKEGIYADLTLYFDGTSFRKLGKLTLPDYRTRAAIGFFNGLRTRYLKELHGKELHGAQGSDSATNTTQCVAARI